MQATTLVKQFGFVEENRIASNPHRKRLYPQRRRCPDGETYSLLKEKLTHRTLGGVRREVKSDGPSSSTDQNSSFEISILSIGL